MEECSSSRVVRGFSVSFNFLLSVIFFLPSFQISTAQLSSGERGILLQVQSILEFPPQLQSWNRWTNFCFLPPDSSVKLVCSDTHITELSIVGNTTSPSRILPRLSPSNFTVSQHTLSEKFSLDSFFTVLTKLSGLQKLSLVNIGLWGPLPAKINRFRSLEVLNLSSNFIYGEIPNSVSSYQSLKTLVLRDNLLSGTVPDLSGLTSLEEVDLGSNYLGPEFPILGNNLVNVHLGNNSLRSEIPQWLKNLDRLQILDVSNNRLVGPIPSFVLSFPSIQYISVAGNQLTGALSANMSCSRNLSFVDLSNNLLIGTLPACLNAGKRRVIIMLNCLSGTTSKYQRPYSFCQKEAIAVKPPVRAEKKESSTLKLGIVLGVIGAVVAIVGIIALLILIICRRVWRRNEYKSDSFVIEKNPTTHGSPLGRHVPPPMRLMSIGLPPYHVFTLEEVEDATKCFDPSNLVAEGSQGQLYRGWLRDGTVALIKCLKLKQKHSQQALQQHVEVISKLRHRHLVSVLGHCIVTYQDHPSTASTVFVVLENISNGSLRDHLTDWRRREYLKWPQRMAITMGVARGIQYLHAAGFLGNDLKIDNILLDDSLTPKISSYNISLPSKVGAESPHNGQDASNRENPEKEDIYRLGVILMEVITGRPMNSESERDDLKFQLERSLAESPSKLRELIEPSMRGTFAYESLKTAAQITINCLCRDPAGRPTVEDVLWHMQYSVQVQEGWTSSGNLSGSLSGNLSNKM